MDKLEVSTSSSASDLSQRAREGKRGLRLKNQRLYPKKSESASSSDSAEPNLPLVATPYAANPSASSWADLEDSMPIAAPSHIIYVTSSSSTSESYRDFQQGRVEANRKEVPVGPAMQQNTVQSPMHNRPVTDVTPPSDVKFYRSAGSALHEEGRCKPCLFLNSKLSGSEEVGCFQGANCPYCHLRHSKKVLSKCRPNRERRERYRLLVKSQEQSARAERHEKSLVDL
jgi:hypothetical protein